MQARGDAVIFNESMGNAALISHQWVSRNHPDPDFEQTRELQQALRHLLYRPGLVCADPTTESYISGDKGISHRKFQERPLFLWYDYVSVPQDTCHSRQQAEAITSIPAYIAKCRFFFALCPTIPCPLQGKVLNTAGWSARGWCRFERAARQLSAHDSWILIQGAASAQVVGCALSFVSGSVGEGEFSVEDDRHKLAPVMRSIVKNKLLMCLKAGDFPAYRRHLNLQTVYLRGLEIEPLHHLIPDDGAKHSEDDDPVACFLHENGLAHVCGKDAAGFWPLHYAALSGNCEVVKGLLAQRADSNRRTTKAEQKLGFPPWMSALDFAVFYHHNDVARLLISARARLEGGVGTSMSFAACTNNVEALRLLHAAGGNPRAQDVFGLPALESAASSGCLAALAELVAQAQHTPQQLGRALNNAMILSGSAELVQYLISLRADVDFQFDVRRDLSRVGQLLVAVNSLKHRIARTSVLASSSYHASGRTPLMAAVQNAKYEGAAALIAAGARLDIRNDRRWTAADFAGSQELPSFLRRGLEGDPTECRRVASLALPDGDVEVPF